MRNLLILLAVTIISSIGMNAQGIKVGVVDTEKIASNLAEFKEIEKDIQDLIKVYQDSLLSMQQTLRQKVLDYQKQQTMMQPAQKQQTEAQLQQEDAMMRQFEQEKFGQQGEIIQRRTELVEPIRQKILKAIEVVAKEGKFELVIDKAETPAGSFVLFSASSIDLTFKVLDQLTKG